MHRLIAVVAACIGLTAGAVEARTHFEAPEGQAPFPLIGHGFNLELNNGVFHLHFDKDTVTVQYNTTAPFKWPYTYRQLAPQVYLLFYEDGHGKAVTDIFDLNRKHVWQTSAWANLDNIDKKGDALDLWITEGEITYMH